MSWSSSDRRERLPDNWELLRQATKHRAKGRCEAEAHVPTCNGTGTEADHVVQGDDHSMSNLQWLSRPCHEAKTRRDNGIVRAVYLEPEQHPGRSHRGE